MKKTFIAALALVAMVGCNKNIIESPAVAESEYGYINLGVSADTEMVVTKGVAANEEYASFNVTLKQGGQTVDGWPKEYSAITDDDLKVAAGTYSIYVENLTSEEAHPESAKGQVRVSGTNSVVVKAGLPSACEIMCNPVNTKVSFNYTEKFAQVFTSHEVNVGTATRNFNLTTALDTETVADAAFFESEQLAWTLKATNANDVVKNFSKTFTPEAGKWTIITFTVGDTDGTINVTITVNGTITEEVKVTETIDPLGGEDVE